VLAPLAAVLGGCGGNQDTIAPAGHPEESITHLWWVMFYGACVGFGVIVFLLFLGWLRRGTPTLPGGHGERFATGVVIALGVAVPIVLLVALFIWSDMFVLKSTAAPDKGSTALTIDVTGHEWWWSARYRGSNAVTANEIHIPTHTRVAVVVTTADVIHSFWVPRLNRKVDMIPGLANRLLLDADRPDVFRGQCAEFCGLQHAHMAVIVVAEPKAKFDAWLRRNAAAASGGGRGEKVFGARGCGECHTVRGTSAGGTAGPDLTHFGGRSTIAAGTVTNTPAHLREWLRDPQHVKPGNRMPDLHLGSGDIDALTAYLEGLR
jgi:cytochrome c oxidase subunit 2